MPDPLVLYKVDEKVGIVTLNRPEKLNAISAELQEQLTDTFARADAAGFRTALYAGLDVVGPLYATQTEFGQKFRDKWPPKASPPRSDGDRRSSENNPSPGLARAGPAVIAQDAGRRAVGPARGVRCARPRRERSRRARSPQERRPAPAGNPPPSAPI